MNTKTQLNNLQKLILSKPNRALDQIKKLNNNSQMVKNLAIRHSITENESKLKLIGSKLNELDTLMDIFGVDELDHTFCFNLRSDLLRINNEGWTIYNNLVVKP